jgi:hypothetical protein
MSTCHGFDGLEAVGKGLPGAPFGVLVGPAAAMDWHDALVASTVLYHRFTKVVPTTTEELESIVKAMQGAAGVPEGMFRFAVGKDVEGQLASRFARVLADRDRQLQMMAAAVRIQGLIVRRRAPRASGT